MDDRIEIQNYLPHRAPMLMVDYIESIDKENVRTAFKIKEDNIFIENGRFCEAGLVENAAQTCSSIVAKSYIFREDGIENTHIELIGFISSVKTVKIYALPVAGSEIKTRANLLSRFDTDSYTTCMMRCSIFCDEKLLLEGEINLIIQAKENEKERSTTG